MSHLLPRITQLSPSEQWIIDFCRSLTNYTARTVILLVSDATPVSRQLPRLEARGVPDPTAPWEQIGSAALRRHLRKEPL